MNFMKNEKSDEGFNEDRHSASSGSRRVMWKLSDDEETFDSIVNYRRMSYRKNNVSNNAEAETSAATADDAAAASTASAPPTASCHNVAPTQHRSGSGAWTYIFNLIKTNKLADELAQPAALALRYKPSKESLKYKRSKDKQLQQQQKSSDKPNRKIVITDLKMECCALPPQQCAVVAELPPKFAQRCTNETDSSDNGETSKGAEAVVAAIVANPKPTSSRSAALNAHTPDSSLDAFISSLQTPSPSSPSACNRQTTKRKMQTAKTPKSTNSAQKLSNNATATNTFRQRQLELHRYRLQVEQRRLELLELKIAREREEAVRQQILFQKDLEFKSTQLKQVMDDMSSI